MTVTLSCKAENGTLADAELFIAQYDEGVLVSGISSCAAEDNSKQISGTLKISDSAESVTVFLWRKGELTPILSKWTIDLDSFAE